MKKKPRTVAALLGTALAAAIAGCAGTMPSNNPSTPYPFAGPGVTSPAAPAAAGPAATGTAMSLAPAQSLANSGIGGAPASQSLTTPNALSPFKTAANSLFAPVSTPAATNTLTAAPASTATPTGTTTGTPAQPTSYSPLNDAPAPGTQDLRRYPMPVSGTETVTRGQSPDSGWVSQSSVPQPSTNVRMQSPPGAAAPPQTAFPGVVPPEMIQQPAVDGLANGPPPVDVDVLVDEARTGRFMFGVGVNSELGVTGQIVIDERNFDWKRVPTSWDDIWNGTAWRGGGQGFRLEAMPGDQVQRYMASFTEPYFYLPGIAEPLSLNLSGFFFNRRYIDWSEERLGGRIGLGYRLTHDLSLTTAFRAESVDVYDPRVLGCPQLDNVLGKNDFFSGRVTLTHDTRDTAFAPTEGHLFELSYEQAFGSFDYPRGEMEYHQYFLMRERPDGSGRHTLGYSFNLGFSGSQTPLFENYFAGGFSTLRGFEFRGASPVGDYGVIVGGPFRFLGSVEYTFPLTADDMLKGVVFCDYGTVEQSIGIHGDQYRVAPGAGLRIAIPALGPAPLALDLAFPVAKAETDQVQNFSFFLGFTR